MRTQTTYSLALTLVLALATACGDDFEGAVKADAGDTSIQPDLPEPDVVLDEDTAEALCVPSQTRCLDRNNVETCSEDGSAWVQSACAGDHRCDEAQHSCMPIVCLAGDSMECTDANHFLVCNTTGTGTFEAVCPGDAPCADGRCQGLICQPFSSRCKDPNTVEVCLEDGTAFGSPQPCGLGLECDEGECRELCTINKKVSSYIGCEYWSLDLDNFDDAATQNHAIVVSNPNPELSAEIEITRGYDTAVALSTSTTVAPMAQAIYQMPLDANISLPEISDKAFRVTSNIPITAHQFNPLNNLDVYSNDGTLLIPTNALGNEYLVMSWEQRPQPPLHGFLTIANTSGEPNEVTLTMTAATASGPNVPRLEVGEVATFELAPGEVLNYGTAETAGDFTGTEIVSRHPVAVFGGHECANVVVGIDRCDHIESQLFPVNTWGTQYVGTKFFPRGTEPDIWRVLASEDDTTITTEPFIEGAEGAILDRGEFLEFETRRDFLITSSAPVSVGHYMVGSNWLGIPRVCNEGIDEGNPTGIGDPALTMAVPFNQFRRDYIVLTPQDYEEDYLNIVAEVGTTVILDGQPVAETEFRPVGDAETGYVVAALRVEDGTHRVEADMPIGLDAYGYDCHVSYAYPGGLNLEVSQSP